MPIPIKIECACGQRYAFDADPVDGRMNFAVACPVCGRDGTEDANAIIARAQPAATVASSDAPAAKVRIHVPAPERPARTVPAGVRVDAATLGLVDRSTAETQARAKISWGDSKDEVVRYLMLQGFSAADAQERVAVLFKERLAALRVKGIRKIVTGIGLIFVPVIEFLIFAHIGLILVKLMAIGVMVGLWGIWQVINGFILIAAPKMESGDVAAD